MRYFEFDNFLSLLNTAFAMMTKESYGVTLFDGPAKNLENDPELYTLVFQRVMNSKQVAFNTTNPVIRCVHLYGIPADSEGFTGSSTKNIVRMQQKKMDVGIHP